MQFCMEVLLFKSYSFQLKNSTAVFWQRFSSFKKIFKVKVLKTFKVSGICHVKTYRSFNLRVILKIPSAVFQKNFCSFCWIWNETSNKKRFPVLSKSLLKFCSKTCWKEQPLFFSLLDESFSNIIFVNGIYRT